MTKVMSCIIVAGALLNVEVAGAQHRIFQSSRAQAEAHVAIKPTDALNLVATAISQMRSLFPPAIPSH